MVRLVSIDKPAIMLNFSSLHYHMYYLEVSNIVFKLSVNYD